MVREIVYVCKKLFFLRGSFFQTILFLLSFCLLDLAGGHDGSLRIWEFGHEQEIATYRESGKYQRVTKVHFSPHGGKVCDDLLITMLNASEYY